MPHNARTNPATLPKIPACQTCHNHHYNACPVLWGGTPEPVEPERRG